MANQAPGTRSYPGTWASYTEKKFQFCLGCTTLTIISHRYGWNFTIKLGRDPFEVFSKTINDTERVNKCVKRWEMKKKKGQTLATYWWKVHGYTSRSSPPLWYPFFACQPTDRSSLIRHPIHRDVCARFSLIETCCHDTSGESIVIGVLNPWHCCIVYIRLVTGVNVIDSDLNFNGFVRIEHVRF